MKKILLLLFSINIFLFSKAQIESYTLINSYTVPQMQQIVNDFGAGGLLTPEYPVDVYRVLYYTEYHDTMTLVSGALCVPQGAVCKPSLVSYQHGTTSSKNGVPSYGSAEGDLAAIFASLGRIVVAPDHIGLGASPVDIHPYVHGFSQAHSTINLLRAARELQDDLSYDLSNQLYLFGYSQGGYSTAVTVRYIEELYSDEFKVTAAAPMSGPYNVAGVQTDYINSGLPYATPGYLPYIVLGYQSIYENLYDSLSEVFISPYDTLIPQWFYGHNYSMGYINNQCTPVPLDMMQPTQIQDFNTNPNHPLRVALQDQDLLDWTPYSPMKLFYCTADEQVHYRNAEIADSVWTENGAPYIESANMGALNHTGCLPLALIGGLGYFNSFDNEGVAILIEYDAQNNSFTVDVENDDINDYDILWNNGSENTTLENLQAGVTYSVTLTHTVSGCQNTKSRTIEQIVGINQSEKSVVTIYPNPSTDWLNLTIENKGAYDIKILDIAGKSVFEREGIFVKEVAINIESLSSGVYTIQLQGNVQYSSQFIKN